MWRRVESAGGVAGLSAAAVTATNPPTQDYVLLRVGSGPKQTPQKGVRFDACGEWAQEECVLTRAGRGLRQPTQECLRVHASGE